MDELPTRTVFALTASPRGGVWLAGHGFLRRIEEGPDGRPLTLERVTRWHGFPGPGAGDVREDADGTLWIVYDGGLVRVPARVRSGSYPPPPVALVEATIDGAPLPEGTPVALPHDRNRIELRFAALSFRNPTHLRHQVRLGTDEPWSDSRGSPSFRWVDLPAGDYEVEYRASLDGITWSTEPVRFAFRVLAPWYATPWAIALAILIVTGIGWTVHRARVAHLVALERQRTRIAMDLHDEVGSGLASVGILSGVLAADGLAADARHRAAVDIATAAEDLGHALSDIVWSLDPHAATLDELASRLTEHGERLCADVDLDLRTRFPAEWPTELVDVAVRRNALLIGLEALHNAVRHARADEIELALLPHGRMWQLAVRDDGTGFDAGPDPDGGPRGHGLRSMRRRADEIGARLTLTSAPGRGTTMTLLFSPRRPHANRVTAFARRARALLLHRRS
jgi:signal transduction histidine kinase